MTETGHCNCFVPRNDSSEAIHPSYFSATQLRHFLI
jgi:hypothetical protein